MKQLLISFQKIDEHIIQLIKSGLKFTFGINLIATFILLIYDFFYTSPMIFYIGISLFKASLFFIITVIICGLAFQKIKTDLGD